MSAIRRLVLLSLSFISIGPAGGAGVGVGGRARIIRPEWIGPAADSHVNRSDDSRRSALELASAAASFAANQRPIPPPLRFCDGARRFFARLPNILSR